MPYFAQLRRTLVSAPALCALLAVAVRLAVLAQGWNANPLVGRPALDGFVYLTWAKDIADGDLLGRSGFVGSTASAYVSPPPGPTATLRSS
jgi:hypothetical protein